MHNHWTFKSYYKSVFKFSLEEVEAENLIKAWNNVALTIGKSHPSTLISIISSYGETQKLSKEAAMCLMRN